MTRRRAYTTEIRVLLCQTCGAPLEIAPQGGVIACSYCRAQNQIAKRPSAIIAPPSMPIDENERMRRLRMQDGRPFVPPPSLQPLMGPGGFHPAKVDEAFHIYQATRREVQATSSPDAAERLFALTLLANNHLGTTGDDARRRAFLETTLDTVTLPRHVQVLSCLLASASAKEGDVASAEQWLLPCNPRSDDIDADSAFRVARAFVDTVRGDLQAVLHCLGAHDDAYPIADTWDPTAAILRANALERLGDVQGAVSALRARMSKESQSGRATMEAILRNHPQLALCSQSFPIAIQGHAQVAAQQVHAASGGSVGSVFYFVGLGIIAIGVVLALGLGAAIGFAGAATGDSEALFGGVFAAVITLVCTVPLGSIFAFIGRGLRNKGKRAAWLRMHGIPLAGRVRGMRGTGMLINDVPMMRVEIEIVHPSAGPSVASFDRLLDGTLRGLAPGATVPVRVHPEDPREIILEAE